MRPTELHSKIFLDSGDPAETKKIIQLLGFLDGQTTNPTLVSKNPYARERFEKGDKFSETEIYEFYKKVVQEVSELLPHGSVSIEVYADENTTPEAMFEQGKRFNTWITNAHIKYPITGAGLQAAEWTIKNNMRVNMTLCFTQSQAAAVYAATKGAGRGDVFVSPFVGRLDDQNENGMDLIKNIVEMYKESDHHTEVLSASVRNLNHFMQSLTVGADIITAPYNVLETWGQEGMPLPNSNFKYPHDNLKSIDYQAIDLTKAWQSFDIYHDLTDKGITRFASDWNDLIA
jgi:transaldolase